MAWEVSKDKTTVECYMQDPNGNYVERYSTIDGEPVICPEVVQYLLGYTPSEIQVIIARKKFSGAKRFELKVHTNPSTRVLSFKQPVFHGSPTRFDRVYHRLGGLLASLYPRKISTHTRGYLLLKGWICIKAI